MKEWKNRSEQRMIPVTDDWHPNFEGNMVRLRIVQYFFKEYICIISAWGNDDYGMEMQYSSPYPECTDAMYERWKKYIFDRVPDHVNKEWFLEHGFYPA